jgi:hypothetical protein
MDIEKLSVFIYWQILHRALSVQHVFATRKHFRHFKNLEQPRWIVGNVQLLLLMSVTAKMSTGVFAN